MNSRVTFVPLLLGALLLGACNTPSGAPAGPGPFQVVSSLPSLPVSGAHVPRQVVVGYTSDMDLDAAVARRGMTVLSRLPTLRVALVGTGDFTVGQALYALNGQRGVTFVQPNGRRARSTLRRQSPLTGLHLRAASTLTDPTMAPYFSQQYALHNHPPESMNVAAAWATLREQGIGAGAYTKDGVQHPVVLANFAETAPTLPDFAGQTLPALDLLAWLTCTVPNTDQSDPHAQNLVNGQCTPPTTLDTEQLRGVQPNLLPGVNYTVPPAPGVSVAAGEVSLDLSNMVGNGHGVIGVAHDAKVMPMAVFSGPAGEFVSDYVYAIGIVWAVQQGATILNNSLGGPAFSPITALAVNYALSHGAIFVAASGDNGDALASSPASLPGVIAVTATTQGGNLAYLSQIAPYVRFGAPGDNIVSAQAQGFEPCQGADCPVGVRPVNGYAYVGGTSSSSPYVASILALMQGAHLQKFGQPMPAGAAEELLYDTGTPSPSGTQNHTAFRIPNADAAVRAVLALTAPARDPHGSVTVSVTGASGQAVTTSNVMLRGVERTHYAITGYDLDQGAGETPAVFHNIRPGTYEVLVGGPETLFDGQGQGTQNPADRLTARGTVTVKPGEHTHLEVTLPRTTFAVTLTTSGNLRLAMAEPGGDGFRTGGSFKSGTLVDNQYVLGSDYVHGLYLIGLDTSALTPGEVGSGILTVSQNGQTFNLRINGLQPGQTAPTLADGGVPDIVQVQPGLTALNIR